MDPKNQESFRALYLSVSAREIILRSSGHRTAAGSPKIMEMASERRFF
jgi:hypothetical protein